MKEFAEDFISSPKVKKYYRRTAHTGASSAGELFVWSPLCFTTDIVIFLPVNGRLLLPRTASRAVKNIEEFPMKAYYIQKNF